MTPARSFVGTLTEFRFMESFRLRAAIFTTLIAICALLSFFPERHRAAVTMTPFDPQSFGISGTLNPLGSLSSVFGNQAPVEIALRVANSTYVRDIVIQRLHLQQRLKGYDRLDLQRWLDDKVTVRSLRGGIIMIELKLRDEQLARDVASAYATAVQERLGQISLTQTEYKRGVLVKLAHETSENLAAAQSAYDAFRLKNGAPSPEDSVTSVASRILQLEDAIKARHVALAAARQLFTDDNNAVRQQEAELAEITAQLKQIKATQPDEGENVGRVVGSSSELFRLQRELTIQQKLYESYLRFLQSISVESMTSMANIRVLEPAYVDTERQVWWPAAAGGVALLLLWAAIEFYRLRPPLGARIRQQES